MWPFSRKQPPKDDQCIGNHVFGHMRTSRFNYLNYNYMSLKNNYFGESIHQNTFWVAVCDCYGSYMVQNLQHGSKGLHKCLVSLTTSKRAPVNATKLTTQYHVRLHPHLFESCSLQVQKPETCSSRTRTTGEDGSLQTK